MNLFKFWKGKKEEPAPAEPAPKKQSKTSNINGLEYYEQNINQLFKALKQADMLEKNDDYSMSKKAFIDEFVYGEKIYEYESIDLEARLTNEPIANDKNAIKIEASCDGDEWFMIGYVPKKINKSILPLLETTKFTVEIAGRKYKHVVGDEVEIDDGDSFELQWWEYDSVEHD